MTPKTRLFLLLSLTLAVTLAACVLVAPSGDLGPATVPGRPGVFPHDVHLGGDLELECVMCHLGAEDEDAAGMPTLEGCMLCHDEDTDADKPPSRTPAGFVLEGEEEPRWTQATKPSVPLAFSHAVHYDADVSCQECHSGVEESSAVELSWRVSMDRCIECHDERAVPDRGCEVCHPGVDESWAPDTHATDWIALHGRMVGFQDLPATPVGGRCELCHQENECNSCHARMEPADHTEPWRRRAHGFSASLDRDRCAACHKEDSCVRCHTQTRPLSHGGAWGGASSAHCLSCHLPLGSDDSCYTCHRSDRSHRSAPRRPPPPHPGPAADCLACHTPLPHFDNGQSCNFCHR